MFNNFVDAEHLKLVKTTDPLYMDTVSSWESLGVISVCFTTVAASNISDNDVLTVTNTVSAITEAEVAQEDKFAYDGKTYVVRSVKKSRRYYVLSLQQEDEAV